MGRLDETQQARELAEDYGALNVLTFQHIS